MTYTMSIVDIKPGKIRGTILTNLNGEEYHSFLGIPYAKPPIGELRFKAPQSVDSWDGVKDCTEDGNACPSTLSFTENITQSEDCLYLNVHTRKLDGELKPVMVYFHGGGFTMGDGAEKGMSGSSYLMTEDIVLVTLNYRLGVFGFLSFEDPSLNIPGNAGLKDQVFALKWVKENISKFNGDPNNVTIFGISAGGSSVHFQLVSPTSKGLYHKAIIQSGSVLSSWAWGQRNSINLAENLGATVDTEKEALKVIQNASTEELIEAIKKIPDNISDISVRRPFGPVIEHDNAEAFLSEDPVKLLKEGRFNKVPTIAGVTSAEGKLVDLLAMFGQKSEFDLKANPLPWYSSLSGTEKKQWEDRINKLYYENGYEKSKIVEHLGDVGFAANVIYIVNLMRKHVNPLYFYVFNFRTPMDLLPGCAEIDGTIHGGDNHYLFPSILPSPKEPTAEMKATLKKGIEQVVKIWTDFARTSVPRSDWPKLADGKLRYLQIDDNMKVLSNPFANRVEVWEEYFETPNGINLG